MPALKSRSVPPPAPSASSVQDENLYPLMDLPRRLWMPRRDGKLISRCTVIRWALSGKGGRRLETLMVGGTRCTCDRWAWQFFRSLTDPVDDIPRRMTQSQRAKDHARAEAELERAGIKVAAPK